jgi:S-DNA-T family DNA segregation ATPase FtsK/SpoIIIE
MFIKNMMYRLFPHKLQKKFKKKVYPRMGIQYNVPILVSDETNENIVRYLFFSSGHKLQLFESHIDLLEHSIADLTNQYCILFRIKKYEKDRRFFEVLTSKKALTTYYAWSESLIIEYIKIDMIFIGISYYGNLTISFSNTPHLFIAGETHSGKGNVTKNILLQLLYKSMYQKIKIAVIDFKEALDYTCFDGVFDVYTELSSVSNYLVKLIQEMKRRNNLLKKYKVENIDEYNKIAPEKLCRYYLIADEAIDALVDKKSNIKDDLSKLARKSRASGIHLILTTQLPSTESFGNQLKNNITGRICGRFADESASRIVLSNTMASKLPETKGRMLYKIGADIYEIQTPKLSNNVISNFVRNNKSKLNVSSDFENNSNLTLVKNNDKQFYNLEEIKDIKVSNKK